MTIETSELRKFLTMEDHPGDVALLEAIEIGADEIDRLRAENAELREDLVKSSEDMGRICEENAELRECIQRFVTEWDTGWEDDGVYVWQQARAILAKTAKEGK